jgi:protein-L-isoaspartate O-methyltransferase
VHRVKAFWERNQPGSTVIDAEQGSPEFFEIYDHLRKIDEPPVSAKMLHEYDQFPGKRVLEVGFGNAYTLGKYAEHGAKVYGLDITETAVKIFRRRFEYQGFRISRLEGRF